MPTKTEQKKDSTDKLAAQPVSYVIWVPRERLHSNSYNPNKVAAPEMDLLAISIIEDGWTQPIVVTPDWEIVDGFHRWTVSGRPQVAALTDGQVPVVVTRPNLDPASQRMSTIRHNRARGTHHVLRMADIVNDLIEQYGLDSAEIERRLGMEDEEVERLHDRGDMVKRASADEFGKGWIPNPD